MGLYIAEGICILSCAGIVYLLVRAYPVAREYEKQIQSEEKRFHISPDTVYAWDKKILILLEKGLRKARVLLLKVDHTVSKKIDSVKKKSEAHEKSSNVFEELEKKADNINVEEESDR